MGKTGLLLLLCGLAGCVTPPPKAALQAAGMKRIAVARPAFADHGIVLLGGARAGDMAGAYREFCNTLEAELEKSGFTVVDYCSRPNASYVAVFYPVPSVGPDEADVILVPDVHLGYSALNNLHPFKLRSDASYALIDARTRSVIAVHTVAVQHPNPPSYFLFDSLMADYENAKAAAYSVAGPLGARVGQQVK